ncbi:hypothetical protein ACTMTU_00850 [Streptomyces sp. OZ13]|uniref:hypothetical protein n=1 Tax=Streptomyces sp. OZ13 TaxID=3452210 RepID=UPI003F88CE56
MTAATTAATIGGNRLDLLDPVLGAIASGGALCHVVPAPDECRPLGRHPSRYSGPARPA